MVELSDDKVTASSMNELKVWKNIQVNSSSRFLVSESRKDAYWLQIKSKKTELKKVDLSLLSGAKIKTIYGPAPNPIIHDMKKREGKSMPENCQYNDQSFFYILTETGNLYWYYQNNICEFIEEFPFMHSEIGEIKQIAVSPWSMAILNHDG